MRCEDRALSRWLEEVRPENGDIVSREVSLTTVRGRYPSRPLDISDRQRSEEALRGLRIRGHAARGRA